MGVVKKIFYDNDTGCYGIEVEFGMTYKSPTLKESKQGLLNELENEIDEEISIMLEEMLDSKEGD